MVRPAQKRGSALDEVSLVPNVVICPPNIVVVGLTYASFSALAHRA